MRRLLFTLILGLSIVSVFAQKTYLHCGQLIDVRQLQVLKEKTVVVEGNKIVEILDGYAKAGAGDKTVDLKSSTVMPGLMDMHVHFEQETSPNRYLEVFTQNDADVAGWKAIDQTRQKLQLELLHQNGVSEQQVATRCVLLLLLNRLVER